MGGFSVGILGVIWLEDRCGKGLRRFIDIDLEFD